MFLPKKDHIYGFKSSSPVVTIFKKGKPFYHLTTKGDCQYFNMPGGAHYDIKAGELIPCEPIVYPNLRLDDRDNFDSVEKLTIKIFPNKNKATIDLKNNYAIIDPKFQNEPEYTVKYVIGHEYRHNFNRGRGQKSERACDKGAVDAMLKIGFNPNQCIAAIRGALSDHPNALIRKALILNELNDMLKEHNFTRHGNRK